MTEDYCHEWVSYVADPTKCYTPLGSPTLLAGVTIGVTVCVSDSKSPYSEDTGLSHVSMSVVRCECPNCVSDYACVSGHFECPAWTRNPHSRHREGGPTECLTGDA